MSCIGKTKCTSEKGLLDLSFAEKAIFTEKIDFPKITYQNVKYFNLPMHKSQFFFFLGGGIALSEFFSCLFIVVKRPTRYMCFNRFHEMYKSNGKVR